MNQKITDIHIKELQIKFGAEQYTAVAVYEEADVPVQEENRHYLSGDMGLKNTMACYDSTGRSFLLKGFLDIIHYYDKVKLYGIKLIR